MSQGGDTIMTTGGNDGGNAGSNSNENNGGRGGAPGGGWPRCSRCQCRHRPEGPCWDPCPRCNTRHHRRSACPAAFAQQQMAALQQQNAQLNAEMQQMRFAMQQRSAWATNFGYGPAPPAPPPPQPFYSWQPQQAMPPMGMGIYPYQGPQYPASLPPPSPFGGVAVGVPPGMPSDALNWFGGGPGQAPRRGGLPWNSKGRGGKRPEKKAEEKDEEKKKEEKKAGEKPKEKEKTRDVLAAEPSGVKKPGKRHVKNMRYRKNARERKQQAKAAGKVDEGEEEAGMSGIEESSRPEIQPSGPPQRLQSEQQIAGADTVGASESQAQEASLGVDTANAAGNLPPPPPQQTTFEGAGTVLATESQTLEASLGADTDNADGVFAAPSAHQTNDETPEEQSLLHAAGLSGMFVPDEEAL